MSRSHYWQYLVNEEGQPVNEANISIFLNGSTVAAWVYLSQSGGSPLNSTPQVQTNDEGFFDFWVADESESHGYVDTQHFDIAWSKPGVITDGGIDDIIIYIAPDPVDETDTDTVKNKLVSNYLANYWGGKAGVITLSAASGSWTLSAGIAPVGCETGCDADYFHVFEHNLDNSYPVVQVWDETSDETIYYIAEIIDSDNTRVWITAQYSTRVTFVG